MFFATGLIHFWAENFYWKTFNYFYFYIIGYLLVSDFILNNEHICKVAFIRSLSQHLNQIQKKTFERCISFLYKKTWTQVNDNLNAKWSNIFSLNFSFLALHFKLFQIEWFNVGLVRRLDVKNVYVIRRGGNAVINVWLNVFLKLVLL